MKTAMVWGASGGIGRALLKELQADGWNVVAIARHTDGLAERASLVIKADVTSASAAQAAIEAASEQVSAIDLWVYSIGDIMSERVVEMSPEDWARLINANLSGAFFATHYSLPLLTDEAHLFYLGAISDRLRLPGLSAYAAAKAGLEAFADTLRKEERKRRVTVVRPGAVATPLWHKVPFAMPKHAMSPDQAAERILAAHRDGHRGVLDL